MLRGRSLAPIVILLLAQATGYGQLLGESIDVSDDFTKNESTYFVPNSVTKFDKKSGAGQLRWTRYRREYNISFNKHDTHFVRAESNEFPATEYDRDPELPFAIDLISPRAVRLRFSSRAIALDERQSLMLAGKLPKDQSWTSENSDVAITYTSSAGKILLTKKPWRIELIDGNGHLTSMHTTIDCR